MQIKKLEYYDDKDKWELASVDFLPNLNLLVGVSGAGKTRILSSIYNLKCIANGLSFSGINRIPFDGVKWKVCFIADNGLEYIWHGEFETRENTIPLEEKNEQAKIINEQLICNNQDIPIVERKGSEIFLNGEKTPKLSPFQSIIKLLKEEDKITPVIESLDKIILADFRTFDTAWRISAPLAIFSIFEKASLNSLKESGFPLGVRISILHEIFPEEFNKIKEAFISVFPNVLDIKIETVTDNKISIAQSKASDEITIISIKEKGIKDWIWIGNISSGMLKTLMYISELYLAPEDCIILIDEFENSLGVNCLDSVTEILTNNNKLQSIITSHHPYIINNISPAYWKIVTRKAGLVTVKTSADYHIPESRQKAFIDLINILEDDLELEE